MKPQYPASEAFSLYALLGYGGLNVDGNGLESSKVDDTGFQWGLGASYSWGAHFSIFIDYLNIANNMDGPMSLNGLPFADADSDALSVGVTYNF